MKHARPPQVLPHELEDHHLTSARGDLAQLDALLDRLRGDLGRRAEWFGFYYRVDPSELQGMFDDSVLIGEVQGTLTLIRRIFARGRKRLRDQDLLAMCLPARRPAAALLSYLLMRMERRAQRLSKDHQNRMRRLWERQAPQYEDRCKGEVAIDDEGLLLALASLSGDELAVTRLCFVEGRSQAEVAVLIGTSRDRVQTMLSKVRAKLRAAIRTPERC